MKYIATLLALLVLAASGFADAPPKELEALNHYVGTWSASITGNTNAKGTSTTQWTLDNRFVQTSWSRDPDPGVLPKLSGTTLMTYDAAKHVYRGWQFFSNGGFSSGEGIWDADSRTFTSTAKDANNGNTTITKASFAQDGVESWSIVTTTSDGKTVNTVSGKNTKQKPK